METTRRIIVSLALFAIVASGLARLLPEEPRPSPGCSIPAGIERGGRLRVVCLEAEEVPLSAVAGELECKAADRGGSARKGDLVVVVEKDGRACSVELLEGGLPPTLRLTLGLRLDINRATEPELEALPRIGPVLARRIVLERERGGPFSSPEDLERVKGIGRKTVARLAPLVEAGSKHAAR